MPEATQAREALSRRGRLQATLGASVYQRGAALVLQAGWQPAPGAIRYIADVSYDVRQTWVRAYEGDTTTFEAVVAGAQKIWLRVAGITPANVTGVFSIVEVTPPPLIINNDYLFLSIRPDDLTSQISRRLDTLDLLQVSADLATESRVIAEEADERGRAAITRIETVEVDVDKAYAIFGTEVLAEFENSGATVSDNLEALATADEAIAQATNQVKARIDNVNNSGKSIEASVTEQSTAIANVKGALEASYTVVVKAGNAFGGFQLITVDGPDQPPITEFRIEADKFLIGVPGSLPNEAVFTVGTVGGVARTVMRGIFIADGMIETRALKVVGGLSAITAEVGTVYSSASYGVGGFLISGPERRFEIWDAS